MNTSSETKMRENNNGDEKRSGLKSSWFFGSGEIQRQNVFRNRFAWLCYEPPWLMILRIWTIVFYSSKIWSVIPEGALMMSITKIVAILMFAIVFFRYLFCDLFSVKRILSKELDQFSRKIIADAPGADTKDWERVANQFNSYLYEKKLWSTKSFIYNGEECYETFRAHILEPFILAGDDPEKLRALEKSIPTGKKALEVYFKEIDKCWSALMSEKSSSALDLENTKLPRDTCYNKFAWGLCTCFPRPRNKFILPLICLYILVSIDDFQDFQPSYSFACFVGSYTFFAHLLYKWFQNRVAYMRLENKIQFLSVIIKAQNCFSGDSWDTVAKQMNTYLFKQKGWRSDQFFFDGTECEQFFKRHFAETPVKKSSSTGLNPELRLYIDEAAAVCASDRQV